MRTNQKAPVKPAPRTHEGGPAIRINAEHELRRSVLSCLLWESEFYESGEAIADRIVRLASALPPKVVADLAIELRSSANLRHVPLLLLSVLAKTGAGTPRIVQDTIEKVIQRADELTEYLAVHAKLSGVTPDKIKPKLSAQMKKGLARAFQKFNEYSLAKYDRANAIRLRDVLFLTHAKPRDPAQADVWKRLIANELAVPDTWETQLSAGADKKETFERLIREGKLGYFALLRNLRNMAQAGCDPVLVKNAIIARENGAERVLPFRYIAAARAAVQFEPAIDQALSECIAQLPILPGRTVVLVDVSGSMDAPLSGKSDMQRIDAAAALAAIWPGDVRMFSFSNVVKEVPARRGMAGVEAIISSQAHSGTYLGAALNSINEKVPYDRIIVITDEQSADVVGAPRRNAAGELAMGYMINVASYQNGVGYGKHWVHIDGFSESVLRYIAALEAQPEFIETARASER